jgi:hypothetical protein
MPKSTTRVVKTTKIADSGIASVLARLMMIVNDMAIVNESLHVWSTSKDKRWESRKGGGRALFGRVQMSYVYEALEVIKEIRDSKTSMAEVEKCAQKTQDCFAAVKAFLDTDDYKKLVQLRNNVGFHYDAKRAERAVKEIAAEFPDDTSTMTLGEDPLDWGLDPPPVGGGPRNLVATGQKIFEEGLPEANVPACSSRCPPTARPLSSGRLRRRGGVGLDPHERCLDPARKEARGHRRGT